MEPRIAMVLAHPYTREAIACATRSMHSREPIWELDPELQNTLWTFAEKIALYASSRPFIIDQTTTDYTMIFSQLPNINIWVENVYEDIHQRFSRLHGVGSIVHTSLMRIAYFATVVAQCQNVGIEPEQFLEK